MATRFTGCQWDSWQVLEFLLYLGPQVLDGLEERGALYFGNTLSFDPCNVRRGAAAPLGCAVSLVCTRAA